MAARTVAAVTGTFDVRQLAASSGECLAPSERGPWMNGDILRDWLLEAGLAERNGEPGRLQLTEKGRELVEVVAWLQPDPIDTTWKRRGLRVGSWTR